MKITERIFIAITLVGLLFKVLHYPGGGVLSILGFGFLSLLYIVGLFFLLVDKTDVIIGEEDSFEEYNLEMEQTTSKRQFTSGQLATSIFAGFSFSAALLGLLFKVQNYPGYGVMLKSSLILLTVVLVIAVFMLVTSKNKFAKKLFLRTFIILLLSVGLYSVSPQEMVEFKYRNNPEYRDILLDVVNDPDCEECKVRLREYKESNHIY